MMKLFIRVSAFFLLLALVDAATMVQKSGTVRNGQFRYTYDEDIPIEDQCKSIVMIGVGTKMSINDYDKLAAKISADQPIVTVFFDHNPRNMVKYGQKKYAEFYNRFVPHIEYLIPDVCPKDKKPKIIAGGHSGAGRGGLQAMMHEGIKPHGFVGLDPYQASPDRIPGLGPRSAPATTISPDLPVLSWGFEQSTCMVDIDIAGKSSYELSGESNRVFFRANNKGSNIRHCEFTDKGCGVFCRISNRNNEDVKNVIAKSIQIFVEGVVNGSITTEDFQFDTTNDTISFDVFVNSDKVDEEEVAEKVEEVVTEEVEEEVTEVVKEEEAAEVVEEEVA